MYTKSSGANVLVRSGGGIVYQVYNTEECKNMLSPAATMRNRSQKCTYVVSERGFSSAWNIASRNMMTIKPSHSAIKLMLTNNVRPGRNRWFMLSVLSLGMILSAGTISTARGQEHDVLLPTTGDVSLGSRVAPPKNEAPSQMGEKASVSNTRGKGTDYEELGVRLNLSATSVNTNHPGTIYAGDDVEISLIITDTTTKTALSSLRPGVWVDGVHQGVEETCQDRVEAFLTGSITARPEYDLNAFYVLSMNDDATITVVDPLFSYGGTRLLTMINLPNPGEDWVLSDDSHWLYVTIPLSNQVAVIDTRNWKVKNFIHVGTQPHRIRLQPDGRQLWVSGLVVTDGSKRGLVSVIDTDTNISTPIPNNILVGQGHHDFAFSDDSRFAYISNEKSKTVSVVDVNILKVVKEVALKSSAGQLVYSAVSQSLYIVDGDAGEIVVLDGKTHEIRTRIQSAPGLTVITKAPNARFILVANVLRDTVHVIDSASDTIVQTADVGDRPSQIVFTLNMAYVLSEGSEIILMIPLERIGTISKLSVVDFTGGHVPFGQQTMPSHANRIAPDPSGLAVVVGNPVDKSIYYYREGMAAPMGEFLNYGKEPRAIMVVDRSMKEREPGVYRTTVHLERSGSFVVAVFLDVPQIIHCFNIEVMDSPSDTRIDTHIPIKVQSLVNVEEVAVGEPFKLRFSVVESTTGQPINKLKDFTVLTFNTSNWQMRQSAIYMDDGTYQVTFTLPKKGVYFATCSVPSRKLKYKDAPVWAIHALDIGNGRD